jgi:hypothetical protein
MKNAEKMNHGDAEDAEKSPMTIWASVPSVSLWFNLSDEITPQTSRAVP